MKKRVLCFFILLNVVCVNAKEFESFFENKKWIPCYYNEVIINQNRNLLLAFIPRLNNVYNNTQIDKEAFWKENDIYIDKCDYWKDTISDAAAIYLLSDVFGVIQVNYIEDILFYIIVEKEYFNETRYKKNLNEGSNWKTFNYEIKCFYLKFDGDYLYIYLNQKDNLLATYCAYDETEYKCLKNAIKTNRFNLSDYTMPRHADGTCDYETVVRLQSGKRYRASDNLRLRSSGSKAGKHVVTIGKGTQVKVLSIGAEQTLDGITSNWVQVEVQAGAKDRDGKSIAAGTTGWCFGGYLTER